MWMRHVIPGSYRTIGILAVTLAVGVPSAAARAQGLPDSVYTDKQVQRPARMLLGMRRPAFPAMLRAAHVAGEVVVGFVVDTAGRVEPAPFYVYRSTHELFTKAVRDCLPRLRFAPAMRGGRRVRQLVIGEFEFPVNTAGGI